MEEVNVILERIQTRHKEFLVDHALPNVAIVLAGEVGRRRCLPTLTQLHLSRVSKLRFEQTSQIQILKMFFASFGTCSCKVPDNFREFSFSKKMSCWKSHSAIARDERFFYKDFHFPSIHEEWKSTQKKMMWQGNEICGKLLHQTIN